METGRLFGKTLAIGVIILFFSMASISAIGVSISSNPMNQGFVNSPIPHLEGIGGDNNWYISDVLVSFSYDPERVDEINYFLDGDWHEYDNPFTVDNDGMYFIQWYWIDSDGKRHDELPIGFKIDQSAPTISLTKEVQQNNNIKFKVTCNDDVSGVNRVEFYLDDEIVTTSTEKPHEYVYIHDQSGSHDVYAVGYNYAGLSEQSDTLDTKERSRTMDFPILNIFFQRIYYIIYLIQQFFLI